MATRIPRLFALAPLALAGSLLVGGSLASPAAADPVPLETAAADVTTLLNQLNDKKKGNEDLMGTIEALSKAFFNIAPFADPEPTDPGADAAADAKAAFTKAKSEWDTKKKRYEDGIPAFQEQALDALVKAVRQTERLSGNKDNVRNDVNQKAALALADIIGSADLVKGRDEKAVGKLRAGLAKDLMAILEKDFEKRHKDDMPAPAALTEAAFGALGKTNDLKVLEWMAANFIHTNNSTFHVERLMAAHKAMRLFTNVPAKQRHAIAGQMITVYSGTEGSTNQINDSDPKKRQQAQAAKAFWDKIKTGVIECVNYYATEPGGGPPLNAEGQAYTLMKDLSDWWRKHDKLGKAPWVDPKEVKQG